MENSQQAKHGITKSVIVVDRELPLGLMVNAAAVLSVTLGHTIKDILGADVVDASGERHLGLTKLPLPILMGTREKIAAIRQKAAIEDYATLVVVDFSEPAQTARTYDDYVHSIAQVPATELHYLGIALYGESKQVSKLTGNLSLLR